MRPKYLIFASLLLSGVGTASASLIEYGSITFTGGIGVFPTPLLVKGGSNEAGCVGRQASGDVLGSAACPTDIFPASTWTAGGANPTTDTQPQSQTFTVGQLKASPAGIPNLSEVGLIFNASQNSNGGITIDQLELSFYSATGTFLFGSAISNVVFPTTQQGTGSSGFAFQLSPSDSGFLNGIHFFDDNNNRVGVASHLSQNTGGHEVFFFAEVPEPASLLTLGSGLIAIAFLLRRRYRNQ